eukprot:m.26237 g.26237  ORF g.26237 m.26237 type:complete len:279 (+) comp11697_c0_seq1:291-1127(+)
MMAMDTAMMFDQSNDFLGGIFSSDVESLSCLAGPGYLEFDPEFPLEATLASPTVDGSPLFSSDSSASDSDDISIFPTSMDTPISSGLANDRFLFDWSPQRIQFAEESGSLTRTPPFNTEDGQFLGSPERPYTHISKAGAPHARQPRQVRSKQTKPFKRGRRDSVIPSGVTSKLASALLPKVDKPSLGELNGKMPRPVVVNASPRRRRKTDKVTDEQIQAEEEARKIKSVQSARDCRKRKKQYIQGLQLAIQQYEQRETVAQHLIGTLNHSITSIKMEA